jgi:hypothetical protein
MQNTLPLKKFFLVTGVNSGASAVSVLMHKLGIYMGKDFSQLPDVEQSSGEDYRIRIALKKFNNLFEDSIENSWEQLKITLLNFLLKMKDEKVHLTHPYIGLKIPPSPVLVNAFNQIIDGEIFIISCHRDREDVLASFARKNTGAEESELTAKLDFLEKKREKTLDLFDKKKILFVRYGELCNAPKLIANKIIRFAEISPFIDQFSASYSHVVDYMTSPKLAQTGASADTREDIADYSYLSSFKAAQGKKRDVSEEITQVPYTTTTNNDNSVRGLGETFSSRAFSKTLLSPIGIKTAELMLAALPRIFDAENFALKGGAAINMFYSDMGRISKNIDIGLTKPNLSRAEASEIVANELPKILNRLAFIGLKKRVIAEDKVRMTTQIAVSNYSDDVELTIDISYNSSGTLYPISTRRIGETARKEFEVDFSIPVEAEAEVYAAKICAAIERQYPKDLFDVRDMLYTKKFTPQIMDCVIYFLTGVAGGIPAHRIRTVYDMLVTPSENLATRFEQQIPGLTSKPVTIEDLEQTRKELLELLCRSLTDQHKQFLLSFMQLDPDWNLFPFPQLQNLPAMQLRLLDLHKIKLANPKKFKADEDELAKFFEKLNSN